ncbi:MAG: bifunctional UDP-3-O-[3-hydroxymyristoyl] N-acetylglucosamine deacetylase/3-hydroxyacyl-ACP dehydratase [Candidatus Rifleibacteriota bacterium]
MSEEYKQHTIKQTVCIEGIGLHTGKPVKLEFHPAPEDSGITFKRTDIPGQPLVRACLENVVSTNRGTVLKQGEAHVNTVEHVLAAICGAGVDNVLVHLSSEEPPACDGSSKVFFDCLKAAGRLEQRKSKEFFRLNKLFWVKKGDKFMAYLPSEKFEITFTLDYNNGLLPRKTIHVVIDQETFASRINYARTFGFEYEFEMLAANNLARGGSLDNAIVVGNDGKIKNSGDLRDPDEFVLHKILDFIGDFSLLGRRIKGHFVAEKTGHGFNVGFASALLHEHRKESGRKESDMMYIEDIKAVLPHRYPFLLVDRILSVVPGESIIGVKNVTANEEFFNGHFPDKPVMPGVLIVEAMAQVAGVLFLSQPDNKGKIPFFCGIDKVRFRRPVVPGDRLEFNVKVLKVRGNTGKVEAEARVDGELVAGGELMFQLV